MVDFDCLLKTQKHKEHVHDCYFCLVNTKKVGKKNQHKIFYPSTLLVIRPIPHFIDPVFSVFLREKSEFDDERELHF